MGGGAGGGGGSEYSNTAFRPSHPVHRVRNTNGFRSISFEKICVLDSNFNTQVYNHTKCRSSSIYGKIHQLLLELWPFSNFEKWIPFDIF